MSKLRKRSWNERRAKGVIGLETTNQDVLFVGIVVGIEDELAYLAIV